MHTTNYKNTLITIAEDSKERSGTIPTEKNGKKTIAIMQYELLKNAPYKYTSDDVLFAVYATRNEIEPKEQSEARTAFFSKGQACFRASPLPKQYGWGVHSNKDGKIAIYAAGSKEYEALIQDDKVKKVPAMRNARK